MKLLEYPLYRPNYASCDIVLYPQKKMKMKTMQFSSGEDLLRSWINECSLLPIERAGLSIGFEGWIVMDSRLNYLTVSTTIGIEKLGKENLV
ncbi:hypothetical protein NPIL_667441 [Nephila pilipes]|uniref:Uncharacterized protein n=1 Tax=Nephila pilipes TaxID=299642 RepID=A0A8X6T9B0_NEPPI|nr:hypothetical protein NPIL_667441 [Nephila pilipes]